MSMVYDDRSQNLLRSLTLFTRIEPQDRCVSTLGLHEEVRKMQIPLKHEGNRSLCLCVPHFESSRHIASKSLNILLFSTPPF